MIHPMPTAALSLEQFIPYRLSIASNAVSGLIATTYEALFGLRVPEWRLIAVLAEREAGTQQALGAATRMDKVTVSRAAHALVTRGLLERAPNVQDARSHLLRLSAAGWRLYREVAPKALEMEAALFSSFSAAERRALMTLLARIDDAATAMARTA